MREPCRLSPEDSLVQGGDLRRQVTIINPCRIHPLAQGESGGDEFPPQAAAEGKGCAARGRAGGIRPHRHEVLRVFASHGETSFQKVVPNASEGVARPVPLGVHCTV